MRKKITMLLASLFACVGAMKAQFPTASTAPADGQWNADTKWYTITVNDKYVSLSYSDANGNLMLNSTTTPTGPQGLWCVVGSEAEGYQFYNMASGTAKVLGATGNEASGRMTMYDAAGGVDGVTYRFDITSHTDEKVYVKDHGTTSKYWNNRNSYLAYWNTNQALGNSGSASIFTEVSLADFVATYKTSASTALDNITTFFNVDATDAKAAVNAIDATDATTFAAIDAVVNGVLDGVAQYVAFRNADTSNANRVNAYLSTLMADGKGHGTTTFNYLNALWSLKFSGGLCLYNAANDVYLGKPSSNGLLSKYSGIAYSLEKEDTKVVLRSNGETLHLNNHAGTGPVVSSGTYLSNYDENDIASRWYLETDLTPFVTTHKASAIATLDSWPTLSVVFDATLIETAKTAIEGFATTDYATFAAIDAELKKVTDDVAAKMLTFQTMATDNGRDGVWISANASTMKAFGAAKDAQDYNAVWSLQHAGGSSFYLYNELNKVYLGAPVNNSNAVVLTETPAAAYTLEMITEKGDNVVEMHSNGGTLHASNHDDDKLISYDGNQDASRWMVNVIDITKDIKDLLATIEEGDYAEVPALGQYSKVGYDALVAAQSTAKTIEEVEAAIAAFNKAKNVPVFMISNGNVKDYAKDKSIYDDNSGTLHFKATNAFDKTMWWALDQAETTVSVTGDNYVGIYNVGTGNGFLGASSIKVTETNENDGAGIADDNLFLIYKNGGTWPAHFQQNGSSIVEYWSYDATSGSAAMLTYVGNTYDLNQLTDAHIAALPALQAAYDAKAFYADAVLGEGLGQYKGTEEEKAAIVATLASAEAILNGTLSEQANTTVDAINAAATAINEVAGLEINLPEAGKYYRFQGVCDAVKPNYYITGHTNADGGRIACTAEADASTIFYFDGTNLVAYQSGLYIGLSNDNWTFASVDNNSKPASTITFAASPRKAGVYTIKSAGKYLHYYYYPGDQQVQVNRCDDDTDAEHDWAVTEVTTLPVTITEAGYATFYAPVEVTLPAEVTAHTVTANGEWATLSDAISVVPAENGVILAGEAGTYELDITNTGAADLENALAGTVAKTLVAKTAGDAYYVLAKKDENVGLYNPVKGDDDTNFYNAGHKAYWHIPAAPQSAGYRFGEGTTSIDNVQLNDNVVIYDLAGRRVEKMEKGIYIVNGKKVIK